MAKKHKKRGRDHGTGMAAEMAYGAQRGAAPGAFDAGLLQGLPALLKSRSSQQFLLGAALGAAAAWVLSDEELRGKLLRAGMKLYAGVTGGFEEMKEQMSDLRSEFETERDGAA